MTANSGVKTDMDYKYLEQYYVFCKVGGWIALSAKPDLNLKGFGTKRIAKIMDNSLLLFTIGATKLGNSNRLNETIISIISQEDADIIMGESTDGSRKPRKQYPGIDLIKVDHERVVRITLKVFGAVTHVQCNH